MPAPPAPALKREVSDPGGVTEVSESPGLNTFTRHHSDPDLGERSLHSSNMPDLAGKAGSADNR